ncbi:reverse transcriptase [Cucumis melo var. makuwa]|uniref:Reverse transcriptase n=1 Tax=Cucumis melo var. makuwa TaxID=1194695 RepID=A0A5A7TI71_CUCMM|nr:reverse transcriptase [Cucumis melo var. makuwa]TYK20365.1 reverse transcriptase [Cucumis melo var. makuwa]
MIPHQELMKPTHQVVIPDDGVKDLLSYKQAMNDVDKDQWVKVMDLQIESMYFNSVWKLVDLLEGVKPGVYLSKEQCPKTPQEVEDMRHILYASIVGNLMYVMLYTRLDIYYVVGSVWCSIKQGCIADSTVEAKYVTACEAAKEVVANSSYGEGINLPILKNLAAINEGNTWKGSNLIQEIIKRGDVIVTKIDSEYNIADPFTKTLMAKMFKSHLESLADESSAPSGYGQSYVRGLGINQTYRRAVFEVSTSLAQTDLPMYSKNPVNLLPYVSSNYITNSVAFGAQSLTHDNGKPILVCEHCKKQRHTKDQCWKLHGWPLRGMSQSLGLISVDGTNPWILDSRATDYLTGFLEHFVSYTIYASNEKIRIADGSLSPIAGKGQIVVFDSFSLHNVLHVPKLSYNLLSISKITRELHHKATFLPESVRFQDLNSGRTIGTARHSRELYIFNDDTSSSSISMTSLLSSYFSTSEHDFMQNNIVFLFPHNHINPHNRSPLSIVTFGVPPRSPPYLGKGGIVHQNSCAYTPQKNGVAERKNCHLLEVARSLMLFTSLPSYLWGDAMLTAAHLINRMSSRILHLQTSLECLKESYPSTRLVTEVPLRVFGCTVYVHSFCHNQTKFTPRAQACVFVGYPLHQRGYKCFHPPSRKYFVTMDVTFYKDRPYFPVGHLQGESVSEESNSTFEFIEPTPSIVSDIDPHPIILPTNQVPWKTYYRRNLRKEVESPTSQSRLQSKTPNLLEIKNSGDETEVRTKTNNNEVEQGHTEKLDKYDPSLDLPTALRKECPEWKNVVMKEMKALKKNNTWEIYALPKGHKPLGCKWVFTLKYKADGTLDRHKASQFMQAPYEEHMEVVKRILRYLKTTPGKGLMFRKTDKKTIEAYTDSDWAEFVVDIKSTSSYCTFVWGNLVTWRSKKQSVVARSSAEAEYRAMSLEISAISIANNPVQHDKTKHVEIDRHFIKERLDSGSICIPYIPSSR